MNKLRIFFQTNSVTIAVTIIFLSLAGIISLQAISLSSLSEQAKRQSQLLEQIEKNAKQRTKQIQDVDNHLDCVVRFFSQEDRSEKAIKDIDTCRIAQKKPEAVAVQPQQPTAQTDTKPKRKPAKSPKGSDTTKPPTKSQSGINRQTRPHKSPGLINNLLEPLKLFFNVSRSSS